MSENNSTNEAENLNGNDKITVRVEINETNAEDILAQLGKPFPAVADLSEIHLIIKHEK